MEHIKNCVNCGKKSDEKDRLPGKLRAKAKGIASFLCATCLWAQVGTAELDFGKVAAEDYAVNDFSMQSIDFAFSTTTSGLTLSASPGDLMIDFAHIHQVSYPSLPAGAFKSVEPRDASRLD